MASVFLSYAREDIIKAERLAQLLEDADHRIWWDRQIEGGARFTKAIDQALTSADAVVVLWSEASVESAWVQDEAAAGRDSGRLVPVLLDLVAPPLGFRQYQSIGLTGWNGRGKPKGLPALLSALTTRASPRPSPAAISVPAVQSTSRVRPSVLFGALLSAGIVAGAWLWLGWPGQPNTPRLVVAAAGATPSRDSLDLARSIAVDLGRYQSGPLASLRVVGGDQEKDAAADYRLEVGLVRSGPDVRGDVSLLAPARSEILWSSALDGEVNHVGDLRQQLAARSGAVLSCLVQITGSKTRLSSEASRLYLSGCARMSDLDFGGDDQATLSILRQVTEKAPRFAQGWAMLALLESSFLVLPTDPHYTARVQSAREHLRRASALDPNLPEIYAADAQLQPIGQQPGSALAILDAGLAANPDNGLLYNLRSETLQKVGRMSDAVESAHRAAQLDPLFSSNQQSYIAALTYAGRFPAALDEIAKAQQIWPGADSIEQAKFRFDLRYGDAQSALRTFRQSGINVTRYVPFDRAWEAFLLARISPTPAKIDQALGFFRERNRHDPSDMQGYIQALGTFGRVDEAFAVAAPGAALKSLAASSDILFRPNMRPVLADRRFIGLADRLGLLAYWRRTNQWPDFCADPELPYDCRKEAARYRR